MSNYKNSTFVLFFLSTFIFCQDNNHGLTVDWIHTDEAKAMSAVHRYVWLDNNTAILYDPSKPLKERDFKVLDPKKPNVLTPLFNVKKAVESLNEILDDTLDGLDWPISFDSKGEKALYNFKGDIFLLDIKTSVFKKITNTLEEEKSPRLSPDGKRIAYVRKNDLIAYSILNNREKTLTKSGSETLLNGTLSWVYWEEIFGRQDIGFWWSNDSKYIAFLETDESMVTKMHYVDFKPQEPKLITQRYPKTGTNNPMVRLGIIDIKRKKTKWVQLEPYEYICRVKWHPDNTRLFVQTMSRDQRELDAFYVNRKSGKMLKKIFTEKDSAWVNINDDLYFLENGTFIWQSERDGFAHLYRFKDSGELVNQITKGKWALRSSGGPFWLRQSVQAINEKIGKIYFTAMKESSVERHLYSVDLSGKNIEKISKEKGVHSIGCSPNGEYYFDKFSDSSTPPMLSLHSISGEVVKIIDKPKLSLIIDMELQTPELFTIPTSDGFPMPAQILKPADFDETKEYPLIYHVYGGPSAPTVFDSWQGSSLLYDNILLRNGYLVVRFDHRSATAISKTLENRVHLMISGPIEMEDIVDGIRWLKSKDFVDPKRVGIWGWSGGGSFTLNAMTNTPEFKAGISGAPVTDWHYYDTKWGEFAMKRPQDNPEGYEKTSFVKSAKNLKGRLLLIHGTYDDNVHPQNSWHFIDELIKHDIMFDMMFYPMRMHGFKDKPAQIHRQKKMIEFWKNYL